MLGHKASLGKFNKIEIIPSIFSHHNAIRKEINYKGKKKNCKNTNVWKLNSMLQINKRIPEEIKEDIKKSI